LRAAHSLDAAVGKRPNSEAEVERPAEVVPCFGEQLTCWRRLDLADELASFVEFIGR
jgi:hypothetical protein